MRIGKLQTGKFVVPGTRPTRGKNDLSPLKTEKDFFDASSRQTSVQLALPRKNVLEMLFWTKQAKRDYALAETIDLIGSGPLTPDLLQRAERNLRDLFKDPHLRRDAEAWLAICRRLRGVDMKEFFQLRLQQEPSNRLYLLNLVACEIMRFSEDKKKSQDTLKMLQVYLRKNQDDCFARLLEALMVGQLAHQSEKTLELLESLYLARKDYTPAMSTMAAILGNTARTDAAIDYASESLVINPKNFQSRYLLHYLSEYKFGKKPCDAELRHVYSSIAPSQYDAILYGPYFLQDPYELRR